MHRGESKQSQRWRSNDRLAFAASRLPHPWPLPPRQKYRAEERQRQDSCLESRAPSEPTASGSTALASTTSLFEVDGFGVSTLEDGTVGGNGCGRRFFLERFDVGSGALLGGINGVPYASAGPGGSQGNGGSG